MPVTLRTQKRIDKAFQQEVRKQAGRTGQAGKHKAIIEWYGKQLEKLVDKNSEQRLKVAAAYLTKKVKHNLNRPVLKYKGIRSNRIQVQPESRSKPGEFPKVETGHLRDSIFFYMPKKGKASREAHVGFPPRSKISATVSLDYGLVLETKMDRSFLRRTLNEEMPQIKRLLLKGWKI